jgi:hypothetical protein
MDCFVGYKYTKCSAYYNMKITNSHILLILGIITTILVFYLIYTYSIIFGIIFVFIFIVGIVLKLTKITLRSINIMRRKL